MNLAEAIEMINRGETPDQYKKRVKRLRRLYNECDDLTVAIEVLGDDERAEKKKKRLAAVLAEIEKLK